jgi:hypothetical protein
VLLPFIFFKKKLFCNLQHMCEPAAIGYRCRPFSPNKDGLSTDAPSIIRYRTHSVERGTDSVRGSGRRGR